MPAERCSTQANILSPMGNHPKCKYTPRGELEHSRTAHHEGEVPQMTQKLHTRAQKAFNSCPCLCPCPCSCLCPSLFPPSQKAVGRVLANDHCQVHEPMELTLPFLGLYLSSYPGPFLSSYHGLSEADSKALRLCHTPPATVEWDRMTKLVPSTLTILAANPGNHFLPMECTDRRRQLKSTVDLSRGLL